MFQYTVFAGRHFLLNVLVGRSHLTHHEQGLDRQPMLRPLWNATDRNPLSICFVLLLEIT